MKAHEARLLAKHKGVPEQLESIKQGINKAAKKGEFKMWVYHEIMPLVRENLESDGYLVSETKYDQHEGGYLTSVEW